MQTRSSARPTTFSQENVRSLVQIFDRQQASSRSSTLPSKGSFPGRHEILDPTDKPNPTNSRDTTRSKIQKSSKLVQLLYMTEDSFRIDVDAFLEALDQVGNLPVAVISMNGACREGKSYVLNYFLRYFKSFGSQDWFSQELPPEEMFSWRSGQKRETVGINIWPEPFIIPQNSSQIAVFLLDCQGLFDDQTTFQQNAMIYALSNLLSSVMIYNVKCKVQENLLQNIQYFSSYAKALSSEEDSEEELPHFVFLVRDFEFFNEYQYGYHGKYTFAQSCLDQPRNYFLDTFSTPPEMPSENQTVRLDVLGSYSDVGLFLLPFPGREFVKDSDKNTPDEDFQEFLKKFIQLFTSSQHLVPKKVGGIEVTGKELKTYVRWWAAECAKSTLKFPEARTIAESTALLQNEVAANNAFAIYQQHFEAFLQSPSAGVDDASLDAFHKELTCVVRIYYEKSRKLGDGEVVKVYQDKIADLCKDIYNRSYYQTNAQIRSRKDEITMRPKNDGARSKAEQEPLLRDNKSEKSKLIRREYRKSSSRQSKYFGNLLEQDKLIKERAKLHKEILANRIFRQGEQKADAKSNQTMKTKQDTFHHKESAGRNINLSNVTNVDKNASKYKFLGLALKRTVV